MFSMQDLSAVREMILNEIRVAAQNADIGAIARWSKAAEQCEMLIRETTELEGRVKRFVDTLSSKPEDTRISGKESVDSGTPSTQSLQAQKGGKMKTELVGSETFSTQRSISPKREGAEERKKWVAKLAAKHIPLTGHDKRYYTKKGKSIGIAFANELDRPQLADKWFLGLKDEPTDMLVLLCRDKEKKGDPHDFIVPVAELGSSWKALSRSGGQVKFNIWKSNSEFLLLIPGEDPISITSHLSNYRPLN